MKSPRGICQDRSCVIPAIIVLSPLDRSEVEAEEEQRRGSQRAESAANRLIDNPIVFCLRLPTHSARVAGCPGLHTTGHRCLFRIANRWRVPGGSLGECVGGHRCFAGRAATRISRSSGCDGVSAKHSARAVCLDACRRMLEHTDAPLATIAAECGFSHQSHMGSAFRRILGVTPGEYQRARAFAAKSRIPPIRSASSRHPGTRRDRR